MEPLILIAILVVAMLFLSSRTRKQQRAAADFRANLAPGQEVMTTTGMFATVVAAEGDVVTLETSPGVTSRWLRPAIGRLVPPTTPAGEPVTDVPDDAASLTDGDPGDPTRR